MPSSLPRFDSLIAVIPNGSTNTAADTLKKCVLNRSVKKPHLCALVLDFSKYPTRYRVLGAKKPVLILQRRDTEPESELVSQLGGECVLMARASVFSP